MKLGSPTVRLAVVSLLPAATFGQDSPAPASTSSSRHLIGQVTYKGAPAAGASLELRRYLLRDTNALDIVNKKIAQRIVRAKCDRFGAFQVELPPGLPFELHAWTPRSAREIVKTVYAGESLRLELRRPAFLEGIVSHESTKKPIVGAAVRGWRSSTGVEVFRGKTDAAGHFHFGNLMPGAVTLDVQPQDTPAPDWQLLVLEPGRTLRRDLVVSEGPSIRGVITDAKTGAPIVGAEIANNWTFKRFVRTDEQGRYALRGVRWDEIFIRAKGYGKIGLKPGGRETLDVALQPGRIAVGSIVDATGQPVAGVYVAAMSTMRLHDQQQTDWLAVTTDAAGRFRVDSVRRDIPHILFIRADGFGTTVFEFPESEAKSDEIDFGKITLPSAIYVTGRVLDERGNPIANTPVSLGGTNGDRYRFLAGRPQMDRDQPRGSFYVNVRNTMTDSVGRYHFPLVAPGEYRLRARVQEVTPRLVGTRVAESKSVTIKIREPETARRQDFRIPIGRWLLGRVMTPSGRVPPPTNITVAETEDRNLYLRPGLPFRLIQLPEGDLSVTATPNFERQKVGAADEPGEGTRTGIARSNSARVTWICLTEPAWIQVFVHDANGNPVLGSRVVAVDKDGKQIAERVTDPRGSAALHIGMRKRAKVTAYPPRESRAKESESQTVDAGTSNVVIMLGR